MNITKIKNYAVAAAVLAALGAIGSVVTLRPAAGQGGPTTTIGGPFPLPVRNTDEPGRIPYQSTVNNTGNCPTAPSTNTCFFNFGFVPAGKRIVVQRISGLNGFTVAPFQITVFLNNGSGIPQQAFYAPIGANSTAYTQDVLVYFDAGQLIEVQVSAPGGTFGGGNIAHHVNLSGYILDCSAPGSCAAIAH